MSNAFRHDHAELLESLISGKLPRNLSWSAAVELIEQIGEVKPRGHDEFAFQVGSQRAFFKKPGSHDLDLEETSRLRKFLKAAEVVGESDELRQPNGNQSGRIVIVIDHHAAQIYQDLGESRPQDEVTVKPHDPFGFQHHLIRRKEAHYKGDRAPEEDSYYAEIAKDLTHAEAIILIGHATGKSSAAHFLGEYLKSHHPETFHRIVATETVDLSALTKPQIEEIAKNHRADPAKIHFGKDGAGLRKENENSV